MAERLGTTVVEPPAQVVEPDTAEKLWQVGSLWFSEPAFAHATSVYRSHELTEGANLWGSDFVANMLNQTLRAIGYQPLIVTHLAKGGVVIRHPTRG